MKSTFLGFFSSKIAFLGFLSTVVGDEKLTSREDPIGPFFMALCQL